MSFGWGICKRQTAPTIEKKKNGTLHVRESNPGRLRDRQECYQLHQHGSVPPPKLEGLDSFSGGRIRKSEVLQPEHVSIIRSYHDGYTASHPNCEVKHRWAQSVLRWGTTRESWVSNVFFFEQQVVVKKQIFVIHFFFVCVVFLGPNPSFAERTSP